MKTLTLEEVKARKVRPSDLRLAASCSFSEAELATLDAILTTLLRGGDTRKMAALAQSLAKKVPVMKATIERQKQRRAALGL